MGTEAHLAGAADVWFHRHCLKSRIVLSPHFQELWDACLPWHLISTAVLPLSCRNWLVLPQMSLCSLLGTGSPYLAGLPCNLWELPAAEDSPMLPGEALPITSYRCHTCSTAFLSPRPRPLQALTQPLLSLWLRDFSAVNRVASSGNLAQQEALDTKMSGTMRTFLVCACSSWLRSWPLSSKVCVLRRVN